ncbi:Tyrosine-protein kinase transmembrane receptor Ror [Amphibalanus amphitrite]|uniref:Tyrosine-protein kinase transmembrane receptor Ror n=1 Tax=Amphibalanus amphitrite TaxID=1232801 RepID=A0A6A4WA58_AMPAM|nr:Tyrosine-protein kinase transmembrane receptor Ror [Amphibalanus amphitrite]
MPPKPGRHRVRDSSKDGGRRSRQSRWHRRRRRNTCPVNYCNNVEAGCEVVGPNQFVCRCPRDTHIIQPGEPCIYTTAVPFTTPSAELTTTPTDGGTAPTTTEVPLSPGQRACQNPEQLCGMEAACAIDVQTGRHVCTCPHDLSQPTGDAPENFKCKRNILGDDTFPSPIPLSRGDQDGGGESSPKVYRLESNRRVTTTIARGDFITEPALVCRSQSPALSTAGTPPWVLVLVPSIVSALLVLLIIAVCWRRRCVKKAGSRAAKRKLDETKLTMPITITENIDLDDRVHSNPNYYHESPSTSPLATMKVAHILKEQIANMSEIGQGQFGKVYKGVYRPADGEPVNVAVKLLKETANVELQEDFIREVEIMASCQHGNIVSLLGVLVQETGVTPWMVFEYMAYGDLAELLRKNAPKWGSPQGSALDMSTLHGFAEQVASGMEYLASQHFVHRDLACRNILVGEHMIVKISDFGMSRDIYTCDYYKVAGGSRMLPVRWMAPESISYGKFTLESDIWSYGVVLWEIYAYGKQPYYGHTNKEASHLA